MKSIGSPTKFCHEVGLQFATKVDEVTPFEDIETALRLIRENAVSDQNIELQGESDTYIFETIEDGENVDYVYAGGELYRREP